MSDIGFSGRSIAAAAVVVLVTAGIAEARGSRPGGGSHSYSSHGSGSRSSRAIIGWGRSTCKSAGCIGKHPTGTVSYPIFLKKKRPQ